MNVLAEFLRKTVEIVPIRLAEVRERYWFLCRVVTVVQYINLQMIKLLYYLL